MTDHKLFDIQLHPSDQARIAFLEEVQADATVCSIRNHGTHLAASQAFHVIPLRPEDADPDHYSHAEASLWCRGPEQFHIDCAAFCSQVAQTLLGDIRNREIPTTVHLVDGEDNSLVIRHVRELQGLVETRTPAHEVVVDLVDGLFSRAVREVAQATLSSPFDTCAPCAMSMELICAPNLVSWRPFHYLWSLDDQVIRRHLLGLGEKDLTEEYAAASLSLFCSEQMTDRIASAVRDISQNQNAVFEAFVTRRGLILISGTARSTTYADGASRAVKVLAPPSRSNHEAIVSLRELETITNAALQAQISHIPQTASVAREIALCLPG